ncbi:MAG: 2-hydroxyacid dehydrogenase [Bacillota bacterium]|nr:D-glycerate dehydrogenase [Bacillota bacterium]NLU54146.1 D-glycerate dehydrogenase [Bacillota bacterium]HOJ45792.1 D-glycerate dehydrogenase [Bacillota bacterium]HPQ10591.1 D-glycerate dehydrogenase [Bacillota bacterium]
MERKKVLITRQLPGDAVEKLKEECDLLCDPPSDQMPRNQLLELIPEADALICLLSETIDREVISRAPKLKVISNYAVGYNNIDVAFATERKIYVTNTPDVLTEATADLAWALLLAAARRVVEGDEMVRQNRFTGWAPDLLLGLDVAYKTLGVVGLGRIGLAVARRAKGFGMRVLYWSKNRKEQWEEQFGLEYQPLDTLLQTADFVSLNVALTPETHHLIGEKEFSLMKNTAILVNTARGPVVDEAALAAALREKKIWAAGLDVYENEPEVHPDLLKLDNVILAPHVGSGTIDTRAKMAEMVVSNVLMALKGQRPTNAIN